MFYPKLCHETNGIWTVLLLCSAKIKWDGSERWKEIDLFSIIHCLISGLCYESIIHDTTTSPVLFLRKKFVCFTKLVITTHREIGITKNPEQEIWAWLCDFQHGLIWGYYQNFYQKKEPTLIKIWLLDTTCTHQLIVSLVTTTRSAKYQASSNSNNDYLVHQWHKCYGVTNNFLILFKVCSTGRNSTSDNVILAEIPWLGGYKS